MAPSFRLGFLTHLQGRGDPAATYRNAQELIATEIAPELGWTRTPCPRVHRSLR